MEDREKILAICQMNVLEAVMSGGGMSIDKAIREFGLDRKEFEDLAREENLDWIANEISKVIA